MILEAVKGDLLEGSTVSELDLKLAEPAPQEHICSVEQVQDDWEEIEHYYDEISGTLSPPELIRAGRAQEIRRYESIKLYDEVSEINSDHERHQAILLRWVDVNKGDENKYSVRCRTVGWS